MKVGEAVARAMKAEGMQILCGYPVNHLIEFAAAENIRPIIVRQERIGLHMADAISASRRQTIGAFCMQHGRGRERLWRRGAVLRRAFPCSWCRRAIEAHCGVTLFSPHRCVA
jgi:hypothetical protein